MHRCRNVIVMFHLQKSLTSLFDFSSGLFSIYRLRRGSKKLDKKNEFRAQKYFILYSKPKGANEF